MTTKYGKNRVRNDLTEAGNWTINALSLIVNDMAFGLDQLSEKDMFSLMHAQIRLNEAVKDIRNILSNLNNQEDKTNA